MSLTAAALVAMSISFVLMSAAAIRYAVPWLRARPLQRGLTALLWVHAFRYIALQIFSSQAYGMEISDRLRDQIVYGDLAGMGLAVLAIVLLRRPSRGAGVVVWIFAVATVVDLANAAAGGMREGVFASATDISWLILTFYVPLLWVSTGLAVWLMLTRGSELS